jgi:hypothetical protein
MYRVGINHSRSIRANFLFLAAQDAARTTVTCATQVGVLRKTRVRVVARRRVAQG